MVRLTRNYLSDIIELMNYRCILEEKKKKITDKNKFISRIIKLKEIKR